MGLDCETASHCRPARLIRPQRWGDGSGLGAFVGDAGRGSRLSVGGGVESPHTMTARSAAKSARRRQAEAVAATAAPVFIQRWYGKVALVMVSVLLLTLAFAPFNQFYLAWVGLVPWLLVVNASKSWGRAMWWGWVGGTAFFVAN